MGNVAVRLQASVRVPSTCDRRIDSAQGKPKIVIVIIIRRIFTT